MKILIANEYLRPRGGDCLYSLRLMDLLRSKGHEIFPFAALHPENMVTGFEEYFADHGNYPPEPDKTGLTGAVRITSRSVINRQAAALVDRVLSELRPDIVHLNNIHHRLTPSILEPAFRRNIPIIWTLHDYVLTCPDGHHSREGKICIKCAYGNYAHAIRHRCRKGSFGPSLLAALESAYYKPEKLWSMVYKFVCPSRYMADFLIDKGFPPGRMIHIPGFFSPPKTRTRKGDYFFFSGRLSAENGVDLLLQAMLINKQSRLIIAGNGPERRSLELFAAGKKLDNVEFVGHQTAESLRGILSTCRAVVVPSVWPESFSDSIMEAMSAGKPVIASRIGGIPEMVDHGATGLLFEPGNSRELAQCISDLFSDEKLASRMGRAGKKKADDNYSAEGHYQALIGLYERALGRYPAGISLRADHKSAFSSDTADRIREMKYAGR